MTCRLRIIASVLLCAVVLTLACPAASASGIILGDADNDGEVTIIDATCIQRTLAGLPVTAYVEKASDADLDGEVTILDATAIQRWLVGLDKLYPIGEQLSEPTEAKYIMPTDEEGWGREIFRP